MTVAAEQLQEKAPSQVAPRGPSIHLGYLDGVRAFAALYVLLHHAWMISASRPSSWRAVARVCDILLRRGHAAVDLFIVISGFCLMLPASRNGGRLSYSTGEFLRRRARRILPPYFFALAISLPVAMTFLRLPTGTPWDNCVPVTWGGIITHVFLIQELFRTTAFQINGPFWSVAVEWKIYFLFPLLLAASRRFSAVLVAPVALIASYALFLMLRWTPINTDTTGGVSTHYIGLFALGMLGSEIAFSRTERYARLREQIPWNAVLALITVACLGVSRVNLRQDNFTALNDLFVGIWSAVLLVVMAVRPSGVPCRVASCKPLVFFGTFSYSIYLIHMPLLQALWQYFLLPRNLTSIATMTRIVCVLVPPVLGCAYVFYLACERPFLFRSARQTPLPQRAYPPQPA